MSTTALATPFEEHYNRMRGWAISSIVVALAGIPYLVLGDPRPYMVIIPLATGVIAFALYSISRPLYVSFVLWTWMFIPLVRRILDYAIGEFVDSNFVMTAPFAAGGVGVMGLAVMLTQEKGGLRQAFILVSLALAYGAVLGLAISGPLAMATDAFDWGLPVVLAALLLVDWRQYPRYRTVILRTLVVAMGLMGVYGLYQFAVLPPWDRLWMESTDLSSIGIPVPGRVRLFGPLNSPLPYGMTLAIGLLGLFAIRGQGLLWGVLAWASAIPATVALVLTQSRTAWGALFVGFFFILLRSQARSRRAILFYVCMAVLASGPLLLSEAVLTRLTAPAASLGSLSDDNSAQARVDRLEGSLPLILAYPSGGGLGSFGRGGRVGGGIGSSSQDSGIIMIFFTLGWGGTLLYSLSLGMLFYWVWRSVRGEPEGDRIPVVAAGMALAVLSAVPLGNMFAGIGAIYLWGFLGLSLAGVRYHRHRQALADAEEAEAERVPEALEAPVIVVPE